MHIEKLQYLLVCEIVLDQGAHDLLRGLGGADVWNDKITMSFLCVADPTCHNTIDLKTKAIFIDHTNL